MRRPPSRHASARPPPRCSPAFCLKQSIILSESRLSNSTYPLYARSQPPLLPEAPNAPRHCGGRHFFFGQVWCRRITYVKCVCAVKRQLRVKRSKLGEWIALATVRCAGGRLSATWFPWGKRELLETKISRTRTRRTRPKQSPSQLKASHCTPSQTASFPSPSRKAN